METALQSPSFNLNYLRFLEDLVGLGRLELPTSRLSGVYSNQLSYRPVSAAKWESKCYSHKCQAKGPPFLSFFRHLADFHLMLFSTSSLRIAHLNIRGTESSPFPQHLSIGLHWISGGFSLRNLREIRILTSRYLLVTRA